MSLHDALILFMAMVALALVPSTSVALVVTRSSTSGLACGTAVVAGIVLGDLFFVCLAILGMAAIAEVAGSLFIFIKILAGLYLVWFGVSLLRMRSSSVLAAGGRTSSTLLTGFLSGLMVTLGDLKAVFFYASFFPAFVDVATLKRSDIVIVIGITLIAVGGVKWGYAYAATKMAALAVERRTKRGANLVAGACMLSAGFYLMVGAL